jgi:excisionase family DNA binding protein
MLRYRLRQDTLRQLLAEHHLSITDAARQLGVSRSYLSQLIRGARYPSPRLRRRMLRRAPFKLLAPDELWERLEVEGHG